MKWAIIGLVLLGALAALCAAILVNTLGTDSSDSAGKHSSSGTEVVLAKMSLPAISVVTSDHIIKDTVSKDKLPDGYLSSPVQAIGRVLAVRVVEGQVLTESCFVTEGTGAQLAAALPHGMRAVSVTLSDRLVTGGLLYPGCVVDVLVCFKLTSAARSKGQAISTTLLRGIQVLAVQSDSVVSKRDDKKRSARRATNGRLVVALLVDPRQAEALQLAASNGSISLSMRNPLDKRLVDVDATVLSQGSLARLGSVLTPAVLTAAPMKPGWSEVQQSSTKDSTERVQGESISTNIMVPQKQYRIPRSPRWALTVIRGREIKQQELAIPERKFAFRTDVEK